MSHHDPGDPVMKALYEGGSGRHSDVSASTNICRLTNIVGQTYHSATGGNLFRACNAAPSLPDTYRFEVFTSRTFLYLLEAEPAGSKTTSLKLGPRDFAMYQKLVGEVGNIHSVIKALGKREKGAEKDI
ncbi:hypothetical protein C8F01DRAFT_1370277 [Mycena amicta]|nr:hypothetical protein C8F01DRAFT_1370277 [Mycena amicta]